MPYIDATWVWVIAMQKGNGFSKHVDGCLIPALNVQHHGPKQLQSLQWEGDHAPNGRHCHASCVHWIGSCMGGKSQFYIHRKPC